jgi:hypothetical protein
MTMNEVFSAETARGAAKWLQESTTWIRSIEPRNRVTTSHWKHTACPASLRELLAGDADRIRLLIAEKFQVDLSEDYVVTANRQEAGDGSLVHTDYFGELTDHPYFFTHRIICYLSDDFDPSQGGLLGLFAAETAKAPDVVIEPRFNTAAVMEMSARSFHAVSQIKSGTRHALVFSFRNRSGKYEER